MGGQPMGGQPMGGQPMGGQPMGGSLIDSTAEIWGALVDAGDVF
ncbi:MAG: hypothetical protein ACYCV4_03070 [Dermatophilaceae bacterium]